MGAGNSIPVVPTLESREGPTFTSPAAKTTSSEETLSVTTSGDISNSNPNANANSDKILRECKNSQVEDMFKELEFLIDNEVVLEDLNHKLKIQDKELKDLNENKYKNIRHIKNTIDKYRDEVTTKKIYLIIIFIFVLMLLSLGYLFYTRFRLTGKLSKSLDF
jgi:hypothetical protein